MLTNEQIDNMNLRAKCQLARSTDDVDTLEYLSDDKDLDVRDWVAQNEHTPKCVLTKLSSDEYWGVRYHVAMSAHTPKCILIKLSNDEDEDVRFHVAKNTHTPIDILARLSNDVSIIVRNMANEQIKKRKCINIDKYTTRGILE